MMKYSLCILLLLFLSIFRGYSHNGTPKNASDQWLLINITENGTDITLNPLDYLFYVYVENLDGDNASLGTADASGNSTEGSFTSTFGGNDLLTGHTYIDTDPTLLLSILFSDFENKYIGDDCSELTVHIKVFKKDGSGMGEWKYGPGEWDWATEYVLDVKSVSNLSISVTPTTFAFCEGTSGQSICATVSNADGNYTIALTDGGGITTFNPSYATVNGDTIKIASNCPAGNYTVKATVTDAASNTAETTFSFVVNANPSITISPNPGATICKGASLTLSITDAKSVANQYAWDAVGTSTDANLPSHNAFNAGNITYTADPTGTMTYQAIAKSAAGCVDTTELLITVNEAPAATLTASNSTVCSGETITLTATPASGQTADSWKWVNPSSAVTANTLTVTPVNTGNTATLIIYRVKSVKGTCESADYTATVTVNPKPNLSVTAQPVAQCEGNQIDLASATLAGNGGLTLTYYSDANCTNLLTSTHQTVAFADSPKSFWVVGRNTTTGCSDTVELKATINQNPAKPTISGPTEVCEGSTTTLTVAAVSGVTYKWYNAANANAQLGTGTSYTTPAFTTAASYTVVAEVAAGCKTASDAHNVALNKKPKVTITTTDACAGTDVNISAALSDGTAPYSHYVWGVTAVGGGASLTVQSDSTKVNATLGKGVNTFTLTVRDTKGCIGTASASANGGYIQGPVLTANPNPFLAGSSTSLTLTAAGTGAGGSGAITDYDFSRMSPVPAHLGNVATNTYTPSVLPTAPTNYRVVMTTANGCKDSADVRVGYIARELAWDHLQGDTVCLADLNDGAVLQAKAIFGTTPYTYAWGTLPTAAGVQSQTVQGDSLLLTFDASTATAGIYPVGVTLTDAEGKSITQTVNLIIGATPDVKINGNASADLSVCLNSTLNLTASTSLSENVTWLWKEPATITSPGSGTQSVPTTTVNTAGTIYKVIATSAYGCVDSAARKVIVNDLPVIVLTANHDSVCPGDQVRVEVTSAGDGTEYSWTVGGVPDGGGKSKTKSISVATQFKVQREDGNHCIATADTTIQVYVPEVLNLSGDQTVCSVPTPNLTLTASGLTGSGVYTWSSLPSDPTLGTNGTSHTVSPTQNTTYYVDGMDRHGCTVKRDSIVIKVDQMPTFSLKEHRLSACNSVVLYDAVDGVTTGATLKYGTTPNFTGGTTFTSTSTINTSGLYYVRAENGVCKSDEDTVRVNILTAPQLKLLASTIETCEPDSVDLAANIDWTPGTGTTFDATNLTYWEGIPATGIQLTSTRVYPGVTSKTYSVQGASDGCPSKTETVTVTINPKPVLAISAADTAVCTTTVDLNAAVNAIGVTKRYFSDAAYTTELLSPAVPSGTYYVIGETSKQCKDSIEVTVRVKPHPVVTLTVPADTVCKDETVTLTVNGGAASDTYSWKVNGAADGETSASLTSPAITAATPIEVTVTNTEGCTTVLDTTIGVYVSTVNLAASSNCQGETVTITATLTGDGTPTGYTWTGATQIGTTNQATLILTASDQTVGVKVTTDKGCTVEGQQDFRGRPCGVLVVEAPDTTICLSSDDVILTAHSFGGTVTDWSWTQIDGPATISPLTFTDSVLTLSSATTLGTYHFEVSVNGGAAKDTAEVTIQQGVTITSLSALDSCSSVVNLQVVAVNATLYDWTLLSGNGTGYNVPGNLNEWELDLDPGETDYTVAVKAYNASSGCEAYDTLSGHILNTGLMLAFGGNDTCGTNIQLPVRYSANPGYGDVVMKYTYQPQNGTPTEDSIRVTPPSPVSLTAVNPGIYVLTKIYATNALGCLVTVNDTIKIGALPEVELDENCLALHKDSTFNLNIVNSGDFDYIWGVQESSDGVVWTGGTGDGATTTSVNGTMGDKDLQYIITATDRNLPQCKASDTARIYRIPDAPVVDIDTINDKRHIQLVWGNTNWADNYTVWSRKWDPYCLTGKDGNVYAAESSGTGITALSWAEPAMDSLEFYYVTANRTICNVEYKSFETDTFGYARHIIDGNTTLEGVYSTYQYAFPYIFDMSKYGATDLLSLVEYFAKEQLSAIGIWDKTYHAPGQWSWETANYFGGGMWLPSSNIDPLPLSIGDCPMIEVFPGEYVEFVLLGRLNDAASISLTTDYAVGKTSLNITYIPFKEINKTTSAMISGVNISKIAALGWWKFLITDIITDNFLGFGPGMDWNSEVDQSTRFPNRAGYDVIFFDATGNFVWP